MTTATPLYGLDLFGAPIEPPERGKLSKEFLLPPFTVLNAREGFWQERKRAWIGLGIRSELGRGVQTYHTDDWCEEKGISGNKSPRVIDGAQRIADGDGGLSDRMAKPNGLCYNIRIDEFKKQSLAESSHPTVPGGAGKNSLYVKTAPKGTDGTSIFDPVLCELCYRWFCPEGGQVLDPFAGGSVRGIVASELGRQYVGIELRAEQIDSNDEQAAAICKGNRPRWLCGDARDCAKVAPGQYDFLLSCPPYGSLERYSDDPKDLSTLEYPDFLEQYRACIKAACGLLKQDRFACWVVGDFRDKRGNYHNFPGDTVTAFLDSGLHLYNEAILVTAAGSLPIRTGKQFTVSRKMGKAHQNVQCYVKGDGKRAAAACQELKIDEARLAAESN